jgi:hypothetical protein
MKDKKSVRLVRRKLGLQLWVGYEICRHRPVGNLQKQDGRTDGRQDGQFYVWKENSLDGEMNLDRRVGVANGCGGEAICK